MNRPGTLSTDINEINFALYLDELFGEDVTQGATTRDEREGRARALILREKAEWRPVGTKQSMAEAFRSVYGEPLFVENHETNDGQ